MVTGFDVRTPFLLDGELMKRLPKGKKVEKMFTKIKLPIFLVTLLLISNLFSQPEQMRIAILDLQPVGVSELTAKTVSDLLRTELFKTKLFLVIERQQMDTILKEQGFQQMGCTETECAVQVGKLLSAHKELLGTVNKLGETFIINARIVVL